MPIVLPLLKLALALQSSWDTYKVLRPPRSQSQRAIAQRKRSMKGALSVWVVWAAVSMVERPLDNTVGFVMPFYSELKSGIFFALLAFRAFVAEPIILQIIRPLLKPYTKHIDAFVDFISLFVSLVWSIVYKVVSMPLGLCRSIWRRWDESPWFNIRLRPLSMLSVQQDSSDEDSAQTKASDSASSQQPQREPEQPTRSTREREREPERGRTRRPRSRESQRSAQPSLADIDAAASRHQRFGSYSNNISAPIRPSSRASQRAPTTTVAGSSRIPQQPQPQPRPQRKTSSGTRASQYLTQPQPQQGSANTTASFYPERGQSVSRRPSDGSSTAPTVPRRASGDPSAPPPSTFKTTPDLDRGAYGASAAAAAEISARMVDEPEPESAPAPLRLVGVVPDTPARFPGALPHGFDSPVPVPMAPLFDEPEEDAPALAPTPTPEPEATTAPASSHPDIEVEPVLRPSRIARTGSLKTRSVPKTQGSGSSLSSTRSAFPATLASTYANSTNSTRPTSVPVRAASLRSSSSRKRAHPHKLESAASTETLLPADSHDKSGSGSEGEGDSGAGGGSDASSVMKKRRVAGGRVARKVAKIEDERRLVPSDADADDDGAGVSRVSKSRPRPPPVAAKPSNLKGSAKSTSSTSLGRASSRAGASVAPSRAGSLRSLTGTGAGAG